MSYNLWSIHASKNFSFLFLSDRINGPYTLEFKFQLFHIVNWFTWVGSILVPSVSCVSVCLLWKLFALIIIKQLTFCVIKLCCISIHKKLQFPWYDNILSCPAWLCPYPLFSLGPAPRPGRVMVLMCLFVCLSPPQKPGPLGTFWIPWTFKYLLDTLDF